MLIAIASGKGGTGKTTVATSLATYLTRSGRSLQLLDADVEEPNCHLFLNPQIDRRRPVAVRIPEVNMNDCSSCGVCSRVCQFNAILSTRCEILVFPELCHSCGGCMKLCPERAIREIPHEVGWIEEGTSGGFAFAQGRLDVGEARPVPVIVQLKQRMMIGDTVLIDAPPGASCAVTEALRGVDFVCLVTEPTPFGLHDLVLAVELCRRLHLPLGVLVNRMGIGDRRIHDYCSREAIPVLAEIPSDRRIASAYSRGELAIDAVPELESVFASLADRIEAGVLT